MKLLTTGATTTEIPEDPTRKASPAGKAANSACLQPVPVDDINYIDFRFIPNPAKDPEDSPSSHYAIYIYVYMCVRQAAGNQPVKFLGISGRWATTRATTSQMTKMRAVKRTSKQIFLYFCI